MYPANDDSLHRYLGFFSGRGKKPQKNPRNFIFTSKTDISAIKRCIFKTPTLAHSALTHLECMEAVAGVKKKFLGVFFGFFLKQPPVTLLPVWQPCKSRYLNFDCQVVESVTAGIYCVKSNFLGWFLVGFWQEWNKTPDKVVIFSKKGRNSGKRAKKNSDKYYLDVKWVDKAI